MAIFGTKKEKVVEAPKKVAKGESTKIVLTKKGVDLSSVIRRPRITEKATYSAEKGVYVFEVAVDASKIDVAKAVKHLFKVTPTKIHTVRMKPQKITKMLRGISGQSKGYKKAYVYLKKGDKIELI